MRSMSTVHFIRKHELKLVEDHLMETVFFPKCSNMRKKTKKKPAEENRLLEAKIRDSVISFKQFPFVLNNE